MLLLESQKPCRKVMAASSARLRCAAEAALAPLWPVRASVYSVVAEIRPEGYARTIGRCCHVAVDKPIDRELVQGVVTVIAGAATIEGG